MIYKRRRRKTFRFDVQWKEDVDVGFLSGFAKNGMSA